ncbi:MAG: cupin domain-containing protein [Dongiaceae bacterium]
MPRVNVKLGRIPPGKESVVYHVHKGDEEWVCILSGRGQAEIGNQNFDVGPGDFMAFPTPSISDQLANYGHEDLIYLMGGERGRVDVAEFPKVGKHIIFAQDEILMADSDKLERMTFDQWLKKK